MSNAR
jgi:hypothetical protein